MIRKFLQNCRKPQGRLGRFVAQGMNSGHASISAWGLTHISPAKDASVLDIGCGGGANLKRLLQICPDGHVTGIDYSEESVAVSRKVNAAELGKRCDIVQGSVSALPFDDNAFDAVIAFETIYFWPNPGTDFREVCRVLRPGGVFLICNEAHDPSNDTYTSKIEGMRIYSESMLAELLSGLGFKITGVDTHKRGWLCLCATNNESTS
ncbi:MAG: class I SAM-dependent methyltransferase [Oscillospiraceae bacterium]|jgi:ubiquinone/menaquinone biosynthesis C-methylase UbiE|nr:class I SAM-dependent methyltransferase [Oscillospiraceae bacterium]